METTVQKRNKSIALEAFDTLFNQHDYTGAEQYWSPDYIQHSAHIPPGREGLFEVVRNAPATMRYEASLVMAEGDLIMMYGRFSNIGQPANWIALDIVRMDNGILVEHWDVIEDEATREESKSGNPMFGNTFPR